MASDEFFHEVGRIVAPMGGTWTKSMADAVGDALRERLERAMRGQRSHEHHTARFDGQFIQLGDVLNFLDHYLGDGQ